MATSLPILCLSHLRWDLVYQRPQHLLTRFARDRRVVFVEEPILDSTSPSMETRVRQNVLVATPHLPENVDASTARVMERDLLGALLTQSDLSDYVLWCYTPLALELAKNLDPSAIVYDCMDELSLFKGASPLLVSYEKELMAGADLVFTGGQSLYEAKKDCNPYVYAFPSSVEQEHFARARISVPSPLDQKDIPSPRLGFFGVVDERMDLDLLDAVASARPDWSLVVIGPVVKIDPTTLPRHANIHYLGAKDYGDLPLYIAGWDVALMPFALNDATRFISPTKTLEYLTAGVPVVSTPIQDVVHPYGDQGLVVVAATPAEFIAAIDVALALDAASRAALQQRVDAFLDGTSWDDTWARMNVLLDDMETKKIAARRRASSAAVEIAAQTELTLSLVAAGTTKIVSIEGLS